MDLRVPAGIRLEEIRAWEQRCWPSMRIPASRDKEARSRTSGFQSETSDHEDKAIHPRRTGDRRIPSPYEASTRMFQHVHHGQECGTCVWSWHCLNLEACGRVYASGSRDLARKERETGRRDARGPLLCGLDANLPTGQRSPRSRNRFNDRP